MRPTAATVLSLSLIAPALLSATLGAQVAPTTKNPAARQPAAKQELAVLYVGSAQGPRTADFVAFLQQHFTRVGTAVYPTFEAHQADAYDVVVLDVEMQPTEKSIGIGPRPTLPTDYARATVLVNGPGVIVAQALGSKIDWY